MVQTRQEKIDTALDDAITFSKNRVLEKCRAEIDALKSAVDTLMEQRRELEKDCRKTEKKVLELEQERERMLSDDTISRIIAVCQNGTYNVGRIREIMERKG